MTQTDRSQWEPAVLFAGTLVISLSLYAMTKSPGVHWGDTAEFQRVAYTLDLPHPTGYPFYILLGRLWISLWPFGTVAAKMNLLSGLFAALTVSIVSILIHRFTGRASVAAFGSLVLAVSPGFWSQAVVAEVYTLHTLLVACILLVLLWDRPLRPERLPLAAFLFGLSLAHHRMAVLLLPGIVAYLLSERADRGLTPQRAVVTLAALVLGLSPYLLTYLRGGWPTLRAFLTYVLHGGGQWFALEHLPEYFAGVLWPLLRQQLGVAGLLLGLAGLGYSARKIGSHTRSAFLLLGVSWVSAILFLSLYRVGDIFAFYPHFQLINAILMALGLAGLLLWLQRVSSIHRKRWLVGLASWGLVAVVVLWMGWTSWAVNDLSRERYLAERSLDVLEKVPSNARLVASWPEGQPLRYQQEVEGWRSDVEIMIDDAPTTDKVQGYMDTGRPVVFWGKQWLDYVKEPAYAVVPVDHLLNQRDLFLVTLPRSLSTDSLLHRNLHQPVTSDVMLEGYQIRPWPLVADNVAQLTLCWSGDAGRLQDLLLIVRIDPEHDWLEHRFTLSEGLDPTGCSTHHFLLPPVPFAGDAAAELRILHKDRPDPEAVIVLETLAIARAGNVSPERLMLEELLPAGQTGDGTELVGAANDSVTSPGISFPVDVYWSLARTSGLDAMVTLELRDQAGHAVDRQVGDVPEPSLTDGDSGSGIYAARHWLTVPRLAEPGLYTIYLGEADGSDLVRASTVEVEGPERTWRKPAMSHSVGDEFADGQISLEGYEMVETAGALDLTLTWKSVEPVEGNWKVFTHLLDPGGEIIAQSDSFPGNGRRWTDTWLPGEYIVDPHTMVLSGPLDGAGYTLLVGLYDPATGVRVPVRTDPGGGVLDAVRLPVTSP